MRSVSRHQRIVIDLSLRILRSAMAISGDQRVDTIEVRLALRCLLGHCPERWPLDMFWSSATVEHDIGRAQGCTAAFNGIVRQLRRSGVVGEQNAINWNVAACFERVTGAAPRP